MVDAEGDKKSEKQTKTPWWQAILIFILAVVIAYGIDCIYKTWEKGFRERYAESSSKDVAQYMSLKNAPAEEWTELKRSGWKLYESPEEVCQEVIRKHIPTGFIQRKFNCLPDTEAAEMIKKGLVK